MSEPKVSVVALLEAIDQYPEEKIMEAVGKLYNVGIRNILNDKFIPLKEVMEMGYKGLRRTLLSLYEVNEEFVLANFGELRTLLLMLKSVDQ